DIDDIPQASQKPGVAYHDPIIEGAPGHGEGHNSGMPLNILAAIAVKEVMERQHLPGTLMLWPGIAEEQLVTVEYSFKGESAHAAGAPWRGRSALDAVELLDIAWNFRREHIRVGSRVHYVITNGGDQPNVVPSNATVWYYYREADYQHVMD